MITLTIPKQENDEGQTIPGGTFLFIRGMEGEHQLEGNWESVFALGGTPPGVILPIDLQKDLTSLAIARGLDDGYKFARFIPAPKKEPKEARKSSGAKKAKSNPLLMGGFNPWALGG